MKRAAARTRPAARGFGLVEMMVSLALGLLVVGGASMLFIATRQANGSTDNLSRVQESVRTSYDLITREIREAGGTPCDAQLLSANVLKNAQGATPDWWATWGEPLHGYAGSTDFPGAAIGTAVAARVDGTAAIAVRYGVALDNVTVVSHDTTNKIFTTSVSNHGLAAGDLLMVCNYRQAALFQATSANVSDGTFVHGTGTSDPGNCSAGLGLPTLCTAAGNTYKFSAGSMLARFTAAGWYIGYNGRTDGGGRSLYRVTRLGPEEVADGVRDMSLHYLLAEGSDYVDAASVTDWSQVMAVRMDLTFESPEVQAATRAGANSARMTRTVGFTINLRNMQP
jgi:type IV pilus assembly protein PilW